MRRPRFFCICHALSRHVYPISRITNAKAQWARGIASAAVGQCAGTQRDCQHARADDVPSGSRRRHVACMPYRPACLRIACMQGGMPRCRSQGAALARRTSPTACTRTGSSKPRIRHARMSDDTVPGMPHASRIVMMPASGRVTGDVGGDRARVRGQGNGHGHVTRASPADWCRPAQMPMLTTRDHAIALPECRPSRHHPCSPCVGT